MPPRTRKTTDQPDEAQAGTTATNPDAPAPADDTEHDPAPLVVSKPEAGTLWEAAEDHLSAAQLAGLDLLRQPLPAHLIGKKPVNVPKGDQAKQKCSICHGYLPPRHQHLDFAGHAAITERLLAADPTWSWAPVADPAQRGLPVQPNSLWIMLTVCGVTRLGFGDAGDNSGRGGSAVKEIIGDALRNAAMRFGVGLELWHKGDLHPSNLTADAQAPTQAAARPAAAPAEPTAAQARQDQDRAAEAAPGDPADVAPQVFIDRMVATTSLAVTTALMRDAGLAGHLQAPVLIPGSQEPVPLEDAFTRRIKWLRSQQSAPAAGGEG